MRRTVHLVVLAVIAALIVAFVGSPSSAQAPGKSKVTGTLSVEPNPPVIGQGVKVGANFPNGVYTVKLFRQEDGSSSWDEVAELQSNDFGNAWFKDVVIEKKQKLYARVVEGKKLGITKTMTISPTVPVEPNANPIGELAVQPAAFTPGQPVEVVANFPNGTFDVTLHKKVGDVWTKVGTDTKKRTSGNAYFKNFVVTDGEELFALRSDGESTGVETFEPTPIDPDNFPDHQGTLSLQGTVYDGQKGTVVANFPNGVFDVTLYRDKGGTWVREGSAKSKKTGNAYISGIELDGKDDYFAVASNNWSTPSTVLTPAPPSEVAGGPKTLGPHVLYVTTNNGGTPKTRGVDYESKAVIATGDEKSKTLDVEEFAVRGNSTSGKPKKPYKIKFDKNQEPWGLKKEKTFVLLANYLDWSLVRTEVAFMLAREMPWVKWTPGTRYTELFLNGKYEGSYQMVESIKIDKSRLDIDDANGQIIEFDPHFNEDGVPGMTGKTGVKYSWKDPDEFKTIDAGDEGCEDSPTDCPDPEGLSTDKISNMKDKIKQFENVLYGPDGKRNWATFTPASGADDWTTYLDLESAVDYYLVREFTKDQDADMFRSNYFFTNNVDPESPEKFYMGPLWDFDRSAGATPNNYFTGISKPTGWWMRGDGSVEHNTNKIHWYTRIAKDPRFLDLLDERWAEKSAVFENAGHAGDAPGGLVSEAVAKIGGGSYETGRVVADNDRARWKSSGSRYDPKTKNYGAEVEWLRGWYDKRYAWVNGQLD